MNEKKYKSFLELIKREYKKVITNFGEKASIFGISFMIVFIIICIVNYFKLLEKDSYLDNLMTEAGGFLFDILLFGLILGLYEHRRIKKDKVDKYKEEIENYRGWKEKEASYRIFGNIKRLNILGITEYDLSNCYFDDIEFRYRNTYGIDFKNSNICGATFKNSILKYANFSLIKDCRPIDVFEYIFIHITTFDNCIMKYAQFGSITYEFYHFRNITNMQKVKFNGSTLLNCSFENVDFLECLFTGVIFKNCTFVSSNIEIAKFVECTYLVTAERDNLLSEKIVNSISGLRYKRE